MTKRMLTIWLGAAAALVLTACAGTGGGQTGAAATPGGAGVAAGAGGAQSYAAGGTGTIQGRGVAGGRQNLLEKRTIYFAFDRSVVESKYRDIIAAHAAYLSAHPPMKVTLEGNTDERGSAEYNLALGERRAEAVKQMMLVQGVASAQIRTISFGKERPVCMAHDEACWRLNRRVDIVYSKQ
ncbi:outer membrane protein P6 precursor [bacterium BMS3Bbin12]|nr:outer membrane protein P6 precursor [bacterium BMS3Abin12]GBE47172.1 outer membrane protein P6 precursor [bacterium BMS3Bbin12]GBE49571.1 outer membrane protein P6 precursor [bacterium BMS3Bbin13]HDJ86666.1 peptidoglycan-associated lipoprotein Pal [Chromatiales bacterium]HDK03080.1 peptidoglycan-associated lipoprotein Pal [Gammaproteobacteria bacterium]